MAHTTAPPPADVMPRLLSGLGLDAGAIGLGEHAARWGPLDLRRAGGALLHELESSGLRGHGGAGFPVAAKWRSVAGGGSRRPVVVANGAEGEPASAKDATLIARVPHLVLDGASAAAVTLGAAQVVAYVPSRLAPGLQRVIQERRARRMDPVDIEVVRAPDAFIAGQESAVVNALDGRGAVPSFVGLQPIRERGVAGRPTLVQNVETLAHVALVARYGAEWFAGVGTERFPGTTLLTVSGRYRAPVVMEAPFGTPLSEVLGLSGGAERDYRGALVGGYGGTWVSIPTLLDLVLTEESARRRDATLGPGVIVLLPASVCPLAEVARVVRYMHHQSAGQCGPCVYGLGGLDAACSALAYSPRDLRGQVDSILDLCALAEGRGACRHPDGVSRFVRSACTVFAAEVRIHLHQGPCALVAEPGVLPIPGSRAARAGGRGPAR